MKKKILLLLSAILVATVSSAQVCEGLNVITFQVGDNALWSPDRSLPHLRLAYEYELVTDAFDVESLCIGAGAAVGYRYMKRSLAYNNFFHTYSDITWSLRGTAHYDILGQFFGLHSDHIDTYATVSLGMEHYYHNLISVATGEKVIDKDGELVIPSEWKSRLVPGLIVGCRYWFTPNFGAIAEIGCDGFSFINAGLSACF